MSEDIREIRPKNTGEWEKVRALLEKADIRPDRNLDYTCGLYDEDENLIATGSCFGDTLRCLAVDPARQGEGLLNQVVSHLMRHQAMGGCTHSFLYTKYKNAAIFRDLGFYEVMRVEGTAVFMENRRNGFRDYCGSLRQGRREGTSAAIVMNANPFTLGHLHLVEKAAAENDTVHLFVLSEDTGPIPASVRKKLVQEGIAHLSNVVCHASGPYLISRATFPSYFLPDDDAAILTHAALDTEIFGSIAAELGITRRYVGEEPASHVTGLYNRVLEERLPKLGISCCVIPRLETRGRTVSASAVRQAIHDGRLEKAADMLPPTTRRYFASPEAEPVIRAIRGAERVIHY